MLSGAPENALAESQSTLLSSRGVWEHLEVFRSTGAVTWSVWENCELLPDWFTFCWCSRVRNHYSQKNQEVHSERVLTIKRAANLLCSPSVSLRTYHHALHGHWLTSPMSLIKNNEKLIGWSTMMTVRTMEIEHCHQPSNAAIWMILNRRSNLLTTCAGRSHYEVYVLHCPLNWAVLILSLYALHIQIPQIQLRWCHHHWWNAKH